MDTESRGGPPGYRPMARIEVSLAPSGSFSSITPRPPPSPAAGCIAPVPSQNQPCDSGARALGPTRSSGTLNRRVTISSAILSTTVDTWCRSLSIAANRTLKPSSPPAVIRETLSVHGLWKNVGV